MEGYCVKCRIMVKMGNTSQYINKRGLQVAQSTCNVCNSKVNRILGKPK